MLYDLARSLLFKLDAEKAHELTLKGLSMASSVGMDRLIRQPASVLPVDIMGIHFPNQVGLAAGLDKDGIAIDALAAMGFGFIEVGTVTPRPQPGNDKPRLFRIPDHHALINRMGFNNAGVDNLLRNIDNSRYKGVLGINIGKNKVTPNEKANDDYLLCLRKVYRYASYIAINVSSPNTPGLRTLQFGESLNSLLDALKTEQQKLTKLHGRYVPIAVKIAPDMDESEFVLVAKTLKAYEMDGVIATNTTLSRQGIEDTPIAQESGGLSGAPLRSRSTDAIRILSRELNGALPIIGGGGICEGYDAAEKIDAGASLVQVYSGFIYRGPQLIKDCLREIGFLQERGGKPLKNH